MDMYNQCPKQQKKHLLRQVPVVTETLSPTVQLNGQAQTNDESSYSEYRGDGIPIEFDDILYVAFGVAPPRYQNDGIVGQPINFDEGNGWIGETFSGPGRTGNDLANWDYYHQQQGDDESSTD